LYFMYKGKRLTEIRKEMGVWLNVSRY
jgi:hypothetical protein